MPDTLTYKVLKDHLVDGDASPGKEMGIRIDQTLTQDATGTTAFLLLEAMGAPRVRTELSVSYIDHNMAQFGPENHNDHLYLQSIAPKVGAYHSRPGNGICHQVHLERFARPGRTLLGSDSHTPTAGGMGMIAIGAGGLDVAVAMAGGAFFTTCPRVIGVELRGRLQPWIAAKDIILRLLSILTTRGNVGCVVEYFGEGVGTLSVPQRATCTNMGAELGATTSVFPADDVTRQFLDAQGRPEHFTPLRADEGAAYDRVAKRLHVERDAATIGNIREFCEGVAACSPSPDNIVYVSGIAGCEMHQVLIGSCTNSSFQDLSMCAAVLKGRRVHPNVELGIAPGSRQVLEAIARSGALADLVHAGARILESACGPCIGQGFSPAEGTISLRTFNRNFAGRTGTPNDTVYLVSPETAVAAALTGMVLDPRKFGKTHGIEYPQIEPPARFHADDSMIIPPMPEELADGAQIVRGPTIVKPPTGDRPPETLRGHVVLKVGDKITTDHIMPAGALLKYRSNVPEYARYVFNCFNNADEPTFAERCLELKEQGMAAVVVAGESYGQGSSREHAALCPMYLGVRAIIAKSIERIHQANLVNFAVCPLTFADPDDSAGVETGDELIIDGLAGAIESAETVTVRNASKGREFICRLLLSPRQRKVLSTGGLLVYTRTGHEHEE